MTIEEEISSHLDMKPRKIKAETKKIVITKSKKYVCTIDENLYDVAYEFLYGITRYLIFPNLSSSKKIYLHNMSCIRNSAGF